MIPRLVVALLLVVPSVAGAQLTRDTARVAPMVVTATRSPLAAGSTPASVTVLTGAQLRAEGVTTVAEALRRVPGLSLAQTGSYGGATSLFIRGGESKFTKVLVDGVPMNDAGGAFDFSTLTTDNIERIEVVRGPASVLYGSDAMAGVIQLFTRRGIGGGHGELSARGGGFGTVDAEGSVRGAASAFEYSVGGGHHRTDGFQAFNSGYRDDEASAQLGVASGNADARLSLRARDAVLHFPTDGSGQVVDSNAVRRDGRLTVGLDAGYRFTPTVALRLAVAENALHALTDNQPDSPGDVADYYYTTAERSRRGSQDLRLDVGLPRDARVTLGATLEREWQESGTTSNFGDTPTASHARRTSGLYSQLLFAPVEGSTVTLGGRLEHNERFGDVGTWRAAASAAPRAGTRLHGSVGTAFREPTFLENYGCCGFVQGNPDLAPERAFSVDAGVEQALTDWASLGVTLFSNAFRNLIDYQYAPSGPDYFNLARTHARGAEVEARVSLPIGVHLSSALTYLDARVDEPGASSGATALFAKDARLLRRPMHVLESGAGYSSPRGSVDLRVLRVGTREDNYFAPDGTASHVTLPPYTRLDLSGELALWAATHASAPLALTLRVENLRNARYTEVAGSNFDFRSGDLSATGYRAPPRRVLVGLRAAF